MKRIAGITLLLFLAFGPALAQQTSADDTPATKEDVEKLFTTMRIREQMRSTMDLMAKQSKRMAEDTLRKKAPNISQKELDHLDAIMDRTMKDVDLEGMIEDMVPVYQRHLTRQDVAAMSAFYKTPTGQKMLREQPQMTAEAMKAAQPRMEKMMGNAMEEAEKAAKEAEAGSKPANADKN